MSVSRSRDHRRRLNICKGQGAIWLACVETFVVQCTYCLTWLPERLWTTDHVIPKSRGGPSRSVYNQVVSCAECNQRKGANVACSSCGMTGIYTTKDRITWTQTNRCLWCHGITLVINRQRPEGAPKTMIRGGRGRTFNVLRFLQEENSHASHR